MQCFSWHRTMLFRYSEVFRIETDITFISPSCPTTFSSICDQVFLYRQNNGLQDKHYQNRLRKLLQMAVNKQYPAFFKRDKISFAVSGIVRTRFKPWGQSPCHDLILCCSLKWFCNLRKWLPKMKKSTDNMVAEINLIIGSIPDNFKSHVCPFKPV